MLAKISRSQCEGRLGEGASTSRMGQMYHAQKGLDGKYGATDDKPVSRRTGYSGVGHLSEAELGLHPLTIIECSH